MGQPTVALKPRPLSIALLDEIHDAFNTRDADQIMAYFHADTTFYPALGPEPVGRTVKGWTAVHKFLGTVLNYKGCDLWEFRDGLVYNKDTFWKIVQK
jgi:hypothetical protein